MVTSRVSEQMAHRSACERAWETHQPCTRPHIGTLYTLGRGDDTCRVQMTVPDKVDAFVTGIVIHAVRPHAVTTNANVTNGCIPHTDVYVRVRGLRSYPIRACVCACVCARGLRSYLYVPIRQTCTVTP